MEVTVGAMKFVIASWKEKKKKKKTERRPLRGNGEHIEPPPALPRGGEREQVEETNKERKRRRKNKLAITVWSWFSKALLHNGFLSSYLRVCLGACPCLSVPRHTLLCLGRFVCRPSGPREEAVYVHRRRRRHRTPRSRKQEKTFSSKTEG